MANKTEITENTLSIKKDEVISLKMNVDALMLKENDTDIYHPLGLNAETFKADASDHPLSLAQLTDPKAGFADYKLGMFFQSNNLVRAGQIIKMKKSEAQQFLDARAQKNGHTDRNVFITDPNDPRLYTGYPVAELVKEA